jgi:hypothetical protein
MTSSRFTLRSHADLIDTFRPEDQKSVVIPKGTPYPVSVEHYFAWTEPSGVYTYLVFKRQDWETPRGLMFQRNGSGSSSSPAGMCDWCHTSGPSDEVGLLTTTMTPHTTGGTWLCLDLSCLQRIEEQSGLAGKSPDKKIQKLMKKIGDFYQRARVD